MVINFFVSDISGYILVFCRMAGMIFFNPLMMRKNLPSQVRVGLVLGLSLLVTPTLGETGAANFTEFAFIIIMIKELMIGVICGFVFQFFYYMLFTAGDVIDLGFGLSAAKAFDPGTNLQISVTGNFFQFVFIAYIFATNCHLLLIKMIVSSYNVVGIGGANFGNGVAGFMITLFSTAFMLAMQLALPFIAATFVVEISMGILMKLIPQINVFALHFQIKILLGLMLLFLFAEPTALFLKEYINTTFMYMQDVFEIVR